MFLLIYCLTHYNKNSIGYFVIGILFELLIELMIFIGVYGSWSMRASFRLCQQQAFEQQIAAQECTEQHEKNFWQMRQQIMFDAIDWYKNPNNGLILKQQINKLKQDILIDKEWNNYDVECGNDLWNRNYQYKKLIKEQNEDDIVLFFTIIYNGLVHGSMLSVMDSGEGDFGLYELWYLSDESQRNIIQTLVNNSLAIVYDDWYELVKNTSMLIEGGYKNGEMLSDLATTNGYNSAWLNISQLILANKPDIENKLWWLSSDAYRELKNDLCKLYRYYDEDGGLGGIEFSLSSYYMELGYKVNWYWKIDKEFQYISYENIEKIYKNVKKMVRGQGEIDIGL